MFQTYQEFYSSVTSGVGQKVAGRYFINKTGEYVTVEDGVIVKVEKLTTAPLLFPKTANIKFIKEKEGDKFLFESLRNGYCRETGKIVAPQIPCIDSSEFVLLCLPTEDELADPNFDTDDIAWNYSFDLLKEKVRVHVVDGKLSKLESLVDPNRAPVDVRSNAFLTGKNLKEELEDCCRQLGIFPDYWKLYENFTSGSGENYTGRCFVESTQEFVEVNQGRIVSVTSTDGGPNYTFSFDENVRYIAVDAVDSKINEMRTYFNYFSREDDQVLGKVYDNLASFLNEASELDFKDSFIFTLKEEQLKVSFHGGKIKEFIDLTNKTKTSLAGLNVLATKTSLRTEVALIVLSRRKEKANMDSKQLIEEIIKEEGHIVFNSFYSPASVAEGKFTGSLLLAKANHNVQYRKNGRYHREDGPAFFYLDEKLNDYEEWFLDGKRHNVYGPAIKWGKQRDGEEEYWIDGVYFPTKEEWKKERTEYFLKLSEKDNHIKVNYYGDKIGDKSFTGSVIDNDGTVCYFKNGKIHREGGLPAYICPQTNQIQWFENHKLHNLNGPALNDSYFVEEESYKTEAEWRKAVKAYREKHSVKQENLQNHSGCGTNSDVRDGDPMVVLSPSSKGIQPTEKEKEKKNMSSMNLKDEAIEAAYRVAVTQIRKMIQSFLADQMAKGARGKKAQENARSAAMAFFSSDLGAAILCGVIGSLLPMISDKLPEKYTVHLDRLAKEFRVDAMTTAGNELIELLKGSAGSLMEGVSATLDTLDKQTSMEIEEKSESTQELVTETISAGNGASNKG